LKPCRKDTCRCSYFLIVALLFPVVLLWAAALIRPSSPGQVKREAYECGIQAASNSRGRYTVRFYIISILFVIFDVETVFLFPWAVRYRQLGWFGFAEVSVFLAILVAGYIWAGKRARWSGCSPHRHSALSA